MKIVFDMQACQSGSATRGIGRYSLSLFKNFFNLASKEHDISIIISNLYPHFTNVLKKELKNILNENNFIIIKLLEKSSESNEENLWRSKANKFIREFYLNKINPDIVYINSLFEGYMESIPISVNLLPNNYITAVTLYDLIPFIDQKRYLPCNNSRKWYLERLDYLTKADLLFAISNYTKEEAIQYLDYDKNKITPIGTDASPIFSIKKEKDDISIKSKLGITKPFILYTGAIAKTDPRKNCDLTIKVYSNLPERVKIKYQLVLCGTVTENDKIDLEIYSKSLGLDKNDVIFTNWIPDDILVYLYRKCKLFVFPSMHEGFGLPVLESIRCGTIAIGSNCTSIPEVIGSKDAMFNPRDENDFLETLLNGLENKEFRNKVYLEEQKSQENFSWNKSSIILLKKLEEVTNYKKNKLLNIDEVIEILKKIEYQYSNNDLLLVEKILRNIDE